MSEPEAGVEFKEHDTVPWQDAFGYPQRGALEKILYRDESQGTYVRLIKMPAGMRTGETPTVHDFDEVIWPVEGYAVNTRTGERTTLTTFAVFPAGTPHGPFVYPEGALFIEFRHYPTKAGRGRQDRPPSMLRGAA